MERIVFEVSKRLVGQGHEVVVITSDRGLPRGRYKERLGGIEVYRYPEYYLPGVEGPINPGMIRHVWRERFDVLHVHGMTPGISDLSVLIARIKNRPVVLSYHYDATTPYRSEWLLRSFYAPIARRVVRHTNFVTVLSKTYAESSPILRHFLDKIVLIPGGVDTAKFRNSEQSYPNAKEKRAPLRILYVGKIIHYKGIDYLISAMKEIHRCVPESVLVISGKAASESYHRKITHEIATSPARDVIYWDDEWVDQEKLLEYYHDCDVFTLPSVSRREAFGLVLLEAMAAGKAVVASSLPGPSDLVEDGVNGFLVAPGDSSGLAKAIIRILSNESLRTRMGNESRRIARQYDWNIVAEQYVQLLGAAANQNMVSDLHLRVDSPVPLVNTTLPPVLSESIKSTTTASQTGVS